MSSKTKFVEFMKSHLIKKGNPDNLEITHTSLGPLGTTGYKGSFHISGDDYMTFLKLYTGVIGEMPLHIVERPMSVGPMVFDFDFHTDNTHAEREYNDEDVEYLVNKCVTKMKELFDIDDDEIKAFVLEKPEPTYEAKREIYKDGIHIIFPDLVMDYRMRHYLFDCVKSEVVKEDGLQSIPFCNTYDEIFDSSVIKNNGLLMFGSSKENREPYVVTKIYNHDLSIEKFDDYTTDDFVELLLQRRNTEDELISFNDKCATKEYQKLVDKIYSKYDGKGSKAARAAPVGAGGGGGAAAADDMEEVNPKKVYKNINNSDVDMAKAFVEILSKKRATEFNAWIRVGWALHNISDTLYNDFVSFSKKSSKFDLAGVKKVWDEAKVGEGYSLPSIQWWAYEDDKEGYMEIIRKRVNILITKAESGTHDDIANVVKEMYKHIYMCASVKKNIWYEFRDHRWVMVEDGYTLAERIATELTKEFLLMHSMYLQHAAQQDGIDRDEAIKKGNKIFKLYEKLKNTPFIKSVMEACARKFMVSGPPLEEQFDTKRNLLGFNNGVYDLDAGYFRSGAPEDFMTTTVGYDYKEFEINSPEVTQVMTFFSQVQQKEDVREYVLRLMSSFVSGEVRDQNFTLWTGSGCHELGTLIRMFDKSTKKIEDIKLGENVLGDNMKRRRVVAIYTGYTELCNIKPFNNSDKNFRVTKGHRLALRCHYKPQLLKEYNDLMEKHVYKITYHEYIENAPISRTEYFDTKENGIKFLEEIKKNKNVIQYGSVKPVTAESWLHMKNNETYYGSDITKYYKLYKTNNMTEDVDFTVEQEEKCSEWCGIELDGNKRYVMGNGFITYNSNGKSTTIDLMHKTFGNYAGVLAPTVLTRKRGAAGNATPEIADKPKTRVLVIQEPEQGETVYVGQMKELTAGNDKIGARALYGNPFYFYPQFKLILICNKLPHIPSDDGGTWRRLRVTPWETIFVDHKPTKKLEIQKDKQLASNMNKWPQPFIWILLKIYYPKYIATGLEEPAIVKEFTQNYRKDSDVFFEFLNENMTETKEEKDTESLNIIYELFSTWHSKGYGTKAPPRKELQKYLVEKMGLTVSKQGMIKGVKINY
jgi:phage/plasmid-associated DNA primase